MLHTAADHPENRAQAPGQVLFSKIDDLAILTISNPPVNAGSVSVRSGLMAGMDRAESEGASGIVILGAGNCFVAGSDLREFGQPLQSPELPDVIRRIETSRLPVVAALHGVALGGGLELALGCDYRIAAPGTKLGLPEVTLGMIPGAGGTQRLPRLIGQTAAIAMICDGRRIAAEEALDRGLIDALTEGDLCQAAVTFMRQATRPKRVAARLTVPVEPADAVNAAEKTALKRGRQRPNVAEAIRLVRAATNPDVASVLADERAVFQRLRLADDAFALRYLFFAERQAAVVSGLDPKLAKAVRRVGVIGGGTMGQGIVRALLAAGFPVVLVERGIEPLEKARAALRAALDAQVSKGRIDPTTRDRQLGLLSCATSTEALGGCDLVIEAVFEDMAVKSALLQEIEAVVGRDAVIATNTSYLDINLMSRGLSRPERVLGLHFFSPADVMKLLEIVRPDAASDSALATGLNLARRLNKQPLVARVAEGFVGNRIYAAYRRRAELLVLDGASPQDVDSAITGFGFAMGVFAVSDASGLDIAWAMRKRQAASRDPADRYVHIPDRLCEAGRLGQKTGGGWYDYAGGKATAAPFVDKVIKDCRSAAGIEPKPFDATGIMRQLMAAIVNEAALLLGEGVAARPSDVDVAMTNGYGFPRWRGGPLYWAAQQDRAALMAELEALAKAIGHGHRAGAVASILDHFEHS